MKTMLECWLDLSRMFSLRLPVYFLIFTFIGTLISLLTPSGFSVMPRIGYTTSRDEHALCVSVLRNGTAKDGTEICPWSKLHTSFSQAKTQIKNMKITFIGDSRTRYIFQHLIHAIANRSLAAQEHRTYPHTMGNYSYFFPEPNVSMEYYWCTLPDVCIMERIRPWLNMTSEAPHYLILGVGAWTAYETAQCYGHCNISDAVGIFSAGLQEIINAVQRLPSTRSVFIDILPDNRWKMGGGNRSKLKEHRILDILRTAAATLVNNSPVTLWSSAFVEVSKHKFLFHDGYHFKGPLLEKVVCQLMSALNGKNG